MPKHKEWLAFAIDDFKAAKCMLYADEIILGPALYHMQQCAEKSLKAFLVSKNQAPKRIHDLVELTHYYSMPDVTTALINLQQAKNILDFVENKIA